MSENYFKIIFEGRVMQGRDPEKVKNELCRIFKWSRSRVDNLFSLAPLTIAENIDYQTALKIYAPFRQAGAQCKIFRPEKGITEPRKDSAGAPSPQPSAPPHPPAGVSSPRPSATPSPPAGTPSPRPSASQSPPAGTPSPRPSVSKSPPAGASSPRPSTSSPRPSASPHTPADASSPAMTCPKCGFSQKEGPECIRCGIVIARYIEFMKRQKKPEVVKEETDEIQITEVTPPRPGPPSSSPSQAEKTTAHSGTLHEGLKKTANEGEGAQKGLAETRSDIASGVSPLPGPSSPLQAQKDKLFTYFSNLYQGSREEADDRGARRVIYLLFVLFALLAFAIPVIAARMGLPFIRIEAGALIFLVAAAILLPILRRMNRNNMQRIASYFKEKIALEQQQNLSLFLAALILWAEQIPPGDPGRHEIGAACDEIALARTPDQEEFTRYLHELSRFENNTPDESHITRIDGIH